MSGKSEERKISDAQIAEQKRQYDLNLQSQLAQLRGQQLGQEEALQRAQDVYGKASGRFGALQQADIPELTGTPEAITRLQGLIRERALPEQQQALSRTKLAQQQAGVRGPEAALMAQQQATKMGTDLARAAEEVALKQALSDRGLRQQEALRRQQSAEEFQKQQALAGLGQALTPVQKFAEKKPDLFKIPPGFLKIHKNNPEYVQAVVAAENKKRLKNSLSGY